MDNKKLFIPAHLTCESSDIPCSIPKTIYKFYGIQPRNCLKTVWLCISLNQMTKCMKMSSYFTNTFLTITSIFGCTCALLQLPFSTNSLIFSLRQFGRTWLFFRPAVYELKPRSWAYSSYSLLIPGDSVGLTPTHKTLGFTVVRKARRGNNQPETSKRIWRFASPDWESQNEVRKEIFSPVSKLCTVLLF